MSEKREVKTAKLGRSRSSSASRSELFFQVTRTTFPVLFLSFSFFFPHKRPRMRTHAPSKVETLLTFQAKRGGGEGGGEGHSVTVVEESIRCGVQTAPCNFRKNAQSAGKGEKIRCGDLVTLNRPPPSPPACV